MVLMDTSAGSGTHGTHVTDLARLAGYIRVEAAAGRLSRRIGPFLATVTLDDANPYLSYAVPDDAARPEPEDVAALTGWFAQQGRTPRLEYFPDLAPGVRPALDAAGFVVDQRLPVMVCDRNDLRERGMVPDPVGFTLAEPDTDGRFVEVAQVQHEAFGGTGAVVPDRVRSMRASVRAGALVVGAWPDRGGHAVGGGQCTTIRDGLGEVAGIAVAPGWRRRGLAVALTRLLAGLAIERGAELTFLTPGSDGAEAAYRRVGFRDVGQQWHVSLPDGS
jgi:ribosomal protein S18 acetylase RimI-like enzyme